MKIKPRRKVIRLTTQRSHRELKERKEKPHPFLFHRRPEKWYFLNRYHPCISFYFWCLSLYSALDPTDACDDNRTASETTNQPSKSFCHRSVYARIPNVFFWCIFYVKLSEEHRLHFKNYYNKCKLYGV